MIEIENLSKYYGEKAAVDHISFTVKKGEILGFLGPNGAGKSTTMNILTGYLSSTNGSVRIDGHDILDEPVEAKKRIGYLPEQPPLYLDMTVDEYLDFVCDLKQVDPAGKEAHLREIEQIAKIDDVRGRLIANLSKGYRQRVGLAQAMVGNPEVLVLDEPTVGLDPKQIIEIRDLIKRLGKSHTIILSSHILQEVSAVCERVIIINKGHIVASDTPDNLAKAMSNENRFQMRVRSDERTALDAIRTIDGVKYVKSLGRKEADTMDFLIEAEPDVDVRPLLFETMSKNNLPILNLQTLSMSLEDIFLQLTGENAAEDTSFVATEEEIELIGSDGDDAEADAEEPDADPEEADETERTEGEE